MYYPSSPNFTLSEESIPSMILGASEGELSVKAEEDSRPRKYQERRAHVLRIKRKSEEQLEFPRWQKFIYFLCFLLTNYYILTFCTISNFCLALYVLLFKNIVNNLFFFFRQLTILSFSYLSISYRKVDINFFVKPIIK